MALGGQAFQTSTLGSQRRSTRPCSSMLGDAGQPLTVSMKWPHKLANGRGCAAADNVCWSVNDRGGKKTVSTVAMTWQPSRMTRWCSLE